MQKRLPTELISPIVATVVAEHLDDLIAGSLSLLPKESAESEESTVPSDSKGSADPADDSIKSLLVASFQVRKATLKVLGEFLGIAYEDDGVGRLASNPWVLIEAVRLRYARKPELVTAEHKEALKSLAEQRGDTLVAVYIMCQPPNADQPTGDDFGAKLACIWVECLEAAGVLLRRSRKELTYRLFGRLSDACLDLLNERADTYRAALECLSSHHAKQIETIREMNSALTEALGGADLAPETWRAGYRLAAGSMYLLLRRLFKSVAIMCRVTFTSHYSKDVDSVIAALTQSLGTLTKFAAYVPDSVHDMSEYHGNMIKTAMVSRSVVKLLCHFLEDGKLGHDDDDPYTKLRLSPKDAEILSLAGLKELKLVGS